MVWQQQATRFSMKSNDRDCITNMQWLCKTWRLNVFKVIHAKPKKLRRRREVFENSHVQMKNFRFICIRRIDPKQMELHSELYDEWKRALRQCWFSLDFKNLVGRGNGVSSLSSKRAIPTSRWPDTLWTSVQLTMWKPEYLHMTKVEHISSAQKLFPENSWDTPWTQGEVGLVIFW